MLLGSKLSLMHVPFRAIAEVVVYKTQAGLNELVALFHRAFNININQ